jgi:hypothetical protein
MFGLENQWHRQHECVNYVWRFEGCEGNVGANGCVGYEVAVE